MDSPDPQYSAYAGAAGHDRMIAPVWTYEDFFTHYRMTEMRGGSHRCSRSRRIGRTSTRLAIRESIRSSSAKKPLLGRASVWRCFSSVVTIVRSMRSGRTCSWSGAPFATVGKPATLDMEFPKQGYRKSAEQPDALLSRRGIIAIDCRIVAVHTRLPCPLTESSVRHAGEISRLSWAHERLREFKRRKQTAPAAQSLRAEDA